MTTKRTNQRFTKARAAAKKAARTAKVRREFVDKFGPSTLFALAAIVNDKTSKSFVTDEARRSMAAYKANLTRGAYSPFVTVDNKGNVKNDKLGLDRI